MSTSIDIRSEVRRTAGGGVDSVLSSCEGRAASLSAEVGTGSGDVTSVVSTALASFGTSASYSPSIWMAERGGMG